MLGDTCDRTCTFPPMWKILSMSDKSPMRTLLSTVQSHMPNRNFVVATAALVTVTFCFYDSGLSSFNRNETLDMLQQQETLYIKILDRTCHSK